MNPVNTARLHLVKTLSLRVGQARSWSELEGIYADINAVFLAELSSEGLEVLCAYVAHEHAHCLIGLNIRLKNPMILQFLRVIVVVQPPFEKAVVRPCARSVTPIHCDTRRIAAPA